MSSSDSGKRCTVCGDVITVRGFSWPESAMVPGTHSVCPPKGPCPYPSDSWAAAAWHEALG